MNRGEMIAVVRNRIGDISSIAFSDAQIALQLDLDAQHVSNRLRNWESMQFNAASFAVVGDGTALVYPLWGVTHFAALDKVADDQKVYDTFWVEKNELPRRRVNNPRGGLDEKGRLLYTVIYNPNTVWRITPGALATTLTFEGNTTTSIATNASAATVQAAIAALATVGTGNVTVTGDDGGPWTVTFGADLEIVKLPNPTFSQADVVLETYDYAIEFVSAPSRNFTMHYRTRTPSIPTGAAYDGRSYATVPAHHHETILQLTVATLLGHLHGGPTQFALARQSMVDRALDMDMGLKPNPTEPRTR